MSRELQLVRKVQHFRNNLRCLSGSQERTAQDQVKGQAQFAQEDRQAAGLFSALGRQKPIFVELDARCSFYGQAVTKNVEVHTLPIEERPETQAARAHG